MVESSINLASGKILRVFARLPALPEGKLFGLLRGCADAPKRDLSAADLQSVVARLRLAWLWLTAHRRSNIVPATLFAELSAAGQADPRRWEAVREHWEQVGPELLFCDGPQLGQVLSHANAWLALVAPDRAREAYRALLDTLRKVPGCQDLNPPQAPLAEQGPPPQRASAARTAKRKEGGLEVLADRVVEALESGTMTALEPIDLRGLLLNRPRPPVEVRRRLRTGGDKVVAEIVANGRGRLAAAVRTDNEYCTVPVDPHMPPDQAGQAVAEMVRGRSWVVMLRDAPPPGVPLAGRV